MADRKLNSAEEPSLLEDSLRKMVPQSLERTSGSILFESGKAVGRKEALKELRQSSKRSLVILRTATAASLTVAVLSLVFSFSFSDTNPDVSVANQESKVNLEIDASKNTGSGIKLQKPAGNMAQRPTARSQFALPNKKFLPTNENTIIGLRNRLTNRIFETDYDRPKPVAPFINVKLQTALELTKQFKEQGAL